MRVVGDCLHTARKACACMVTMVHTHFMKRTETRNGKQVRSEGARG